MVATREYGPQGWYTTNAQFRRYSDPTASTADWSQLMQQPLYRSVMGARDLDSAIDAVARAGYATDPDYARKLKSIKPTTPEQQAFYFARIDEAKQSGMDDIRAELAARQAALESNWGRSAPGGNLYGIKAQGRPLQVAQAGRADISPGLLGGTMTQPMEDENMQPMYEQESPFAGLLSDPMFLTGASLLSQAGGQSGAVGRGLLGGAVAITAQDERKALAEARRMQIEMARQKQQEMQRQRAMQERFMQLVASGLSPDAALQGATGDLGALGVMGSLMGVEGAGKMVDYSNARLPYGQMTQADRANVGIREREARLKEAEAADRGIGAPVAAAQQGISPAQQREIAAEAGKAEAKKRAEARVDLPKAEATAEQTIRTIDDLIAHPGRTWATGSIVGRLPALPGDAYDFKAKLDMAKGQVFLRAYETLKGGGQITQIEGEKAEKAMAALDRAQSEEAFLQGLKDLREAVEAGQRKLRESAGVQGSMEGPASPGGVDYRWQNGRLVPAR